MKRLRFIELLLHSTKERKSLRVTFDPVLTVVKGENDTGKSSLLKTLYRTLGAEPPNIHPKWEAAGVTSALRFSIDNVVYRMVRVGGLFAIFDSADTLIRSFTRVTAELGPYVGELCDFRLPLTPQSGSGEQQATPAFLFLPFYVDQDAGWVDAWSSFGRLGQFTRWKPDVIAYHTGLRPNEFFQAQAVLRRVQAESAGVREERRVTAALLADMEARLAAIDFEVDVNAYRAEIERLVARCEDIRKEEQELKRGLVEALSARAHLERQHVVVERTATELRADRMYAQEELADSVECPTCGAAYANGFRERFAIAADEDDCRELLVELGTEVRRTSQQIAEMEARAKGKSRAVEEVEAILTARRGKIELIDIVRREGRREVRDELQVKVNGFDQKLGTLSAEEEGARERMKKLDNVARKRAIQDLYVRLMREYVHELRLENMDEESWSKLDARISEQGSDLPRALLAYYFAILGTINEHTSSTFCPIVIDSPKQQDQDEENWRRILQFIKAHRPPDSQTIIGLVDEAGFDLGGTTVALTTRNSLLREDQYDEVGAEIGPLVDAAVRGSGGTV